MDIEQEFENMKARYYDRPRNGTSIEDVLQFMLDHPQTIWFWSWEFSGYVTSKGGYLSHRACARASDLALHHPNLVEDRKIGRFKVYRARVENIKEINEFLNVVA
jgi:hypothetical protein